MRPSGRFPRQYSALLAMSKVKFRESSPLLWRVIAEMPVRVCRPVYCEPTVGPYRAEHGASLDTANVESSALQSRSSYTSFYVSLLPLKESAVARFRPRILQCSKHHYYG